MNGSYTHILDLDPRNAIVLVAPNFEYAVMDKSTGNLVEDVTHLFPSISEAIKYHAALPQKHLYMVEKNLSARGESDAFLVRQHEKHEDKTRILYVGSFKECDSIEKKLHSGRAYPKDFVKMDVACTSFFYKKRDEHLESLVALISLERKVYLGWRSQYDNHGHYFNENNSLIHVSDNEDAFHLIGGSEGPYTRKDIQEKGCLTPDEFEKFIGLGLYTLL